MADPARGHVTVEEFLAFDDGTDVRHELGRGQIVAVAPPDEFVRLPDRYIQSFLAGEPYPDNHEEVA